ncbi:uncharacterized protein LOC109862481 [Pseudomyrmex gracilis]|uniref:uncharacterized protein LOC109862481 n=1 Tax=Pseudomyrmex gracilis TaxID=219809 RepID=UPI000994D368|nr:uncharacterized protein LOC109862481 [Pseudomyrmex gracilis]
MWKTGVHLAKFVLKKRSFRQGWVEAFPLKNIRASTVAEVFVNQVVSKYGVPLELHTDQGKNFESRLFQELSWLLGMKKTRTTTLHPQSDGQVERQHQTIMQYLSKSSRHETTEVTPAELNFERDLRLPLDLLRGSPPNYYSSSSENYIHELKSKLEEIHQDVRERLEMKSNKAKMRYDLKARSKGKAPKLIN